MYTFNIGDKVIANGYEGTVTGLCEWSEGTLVEVMLARGEVCVPTREVEKREG